jgi:hypothetical protein
MGNIEIINCETAEEFLNKLALSAKSWWDEDNECHWIFRGQNSSQELVPSIYRKDETGKLEYQKIFDIIHTKLIPTVPNMAATVNNTVNNADYRLDSETKRKNLAEIIKAAFVEIALTEKFLSTCNQICLYTPTLNLFSEQFSGISSVEYFYESLINDLINESD